MTASLEPNEGWVSHHPSDIALEAPAVCPVDQEQLRGVMLFSAAYFAAESSISLRMNAGSGAGTQSVNIWNFLPSHCITLKCSEPSCFAYYILIGADMPRMPISLSFASVTSSAS